MRTSSEPAMRMRAIPQCVRGIVVEDDEDICAHVIDLIVRVVVKAAKPLNGGDKTFYFILF